MDYPLRITDETYELVQKDIGTYVETGEVKAKTPSPLDEKDVLWDAYIRSIKYTLNLRQTIIERDKRNLY